MSHTIAMPMGLQRGFSIVRLLIVVVVLALLAAGVYVVFASLRPAVSVTRLVEGPVVRAVYATGTISPVREYAIRTPTAGTLEKVLVDKGDAVRVGQSLALVVDPALDYALDQAKAELLEKQERANASRSPVIAEFDARIASAAEQLTIAQREESRLRNLLESASRSATDLDRAADRTQTVVALLEGLKSQRASKLLELQREVATAEAAVRTAQWHIDQREAKSPIDGVVLDRPISQGTRVAVNDTLMRVADVTPARLVMRAAVDEEDITHVSVGQKVIMTLYAFSDQTFVGQVKTIYAEADPNRRTFEVDVAVDQPSDRFQAGMTGELAFVIAEREKASVLPSSAVQDDGVYIVNRAGAIERLTPTIGVRAVDRVEILDGLPADARVITSPIDAKLVGKTARATEVDPHSAAGLNKGPSASQEAFKGWR